MFYVVFLDQYPELRDYFVHVNMQRQAVLLTMALQVVVQYYLHSFPTMETYLSILGQEHRRRGIGPEHYPKFRDALLATLGRFHGGHWDEHLAKQWREALDLASEKMLAGYADSARA